MVGISLTSSWGEPVDPHSQTDRDAAERYIQFHLGWFANPIYRGDYPEVMKNYIGKPRYPTITSINDILKAYYTRLALTNICFSQAQGLRGDKTG